MAYADVNGTCLFYTDDGADDPPLLLVHGWACDSTDWSWQIDAFAERHRVIAVDLRGHGRSSPAAVPQMTVFADDLAALLDELGTGPVVAIGHSLGGMVVSILAVEHPDHVHALVGADPAIGISPELEGLADFVGEQMSGPHANEFLATAWAQLEGPAAVTGLRALHRRRMLALPWEFLAETWSAQTASPLWLRRGAGEYASRRDCPVFSIYGEAERAEWEARTFRHPSSRAIAWPGSGHWLNQERPLEFNTLVLDWISGLSPRPSPSPAAGRRATG